MFSFKKSFLRNVRYHLKKSSQFYCTQRVSLPEGHAFTRRASARVAQFVAQMLAVHGANLGSLLIANFLAAVLAAEALELHVFGLLPSFAAEARLLRWLDVLPLAPRAPPQIICSDAYCYLNFYREKSTHLLLPLTTSGCTRCGKCCSNGSSSKWGFCAGSLRNKPCTQTSRNSCCG